MEVGFTMINIQITDVGYAIIETGEKIPFGEILIKRIDEYERINLNYSEAIQMINEKNSEIRQLKSEFHKKLFGLTETQIDGFTVINKEIVPCDNEYKHLTFREKTILEKEQWDKKDNEVFEASGVSVNLFFNLQIRIQFIENFKAIFINNNENKSLIEEAIKKIFTNESTKEYTHRVILDDNNRLQIVYIVDKIDDLLLHDLYMSVEKDVKFDLCNYCNKIYIRTGKNEYCSECKTKGNNIKIKLINLNNDRCARLHKKIYNLLNSRSQTRDSIQQGRYDVLKQDFLYSSDEWRENIKQGIAIEESYYEWLLDFQKGINPRNYKKKEGEKHGNSNSVQG